MTYNVLSGTLNLYTTTVQHNHEPAVDTRPLSTLNMIWSHLTSCGNNACICLQFTTTTVLDTEWSNNLLTCSLFSILHVVSWAIPLLSVCLCVGVRRVNLVRCYQCQMLLLKPFTYWWRVTLWRSWMMSWLVIRWRRRRWQRQNGTWPEVCNYIYLSVCLCLCVCLSMCLCLSACLYVVSKLLCFSCSSRSSNSSDVSSCKTSLNQVKLFSGEHFWALPYLLREVPRSHLMALESRTRQLDNYRTRHSRWLKLE